MTDYRQADCLDHDPYMWTLVGHTLDPGNDEAITICRGCPIQAGCLEDAIVQSAYGVIRGAHAFHTPARPSRPPSIRLRYGAPAERKIVHQAYELARLGTPRRDMPTQLGITRPRLEKAFHRCQISITTLDNPTGSETAA